MKKQTKTLLIIISIILLVIISGVFLFTQFSKNNGSDRLTNTKSIENVLAKHESSIMSVPGVAGIGIGDCNGQQCLKIYLEKETAESKKIPAEIEGFKVEKEITGPINALPDQSKPNTPPTSDQCGIENCHGLDIVCGKNPAEMCTMMYQLGDRCRQYAQCGQVNGKCQQIENPQFTACKSCAKKCEKDFPNDPDKAFACESKCGE